MRQQQKPVIVALALLIASWLTVRAGIYAGSQMLPPGEGYQQSLGIDSDLFRFDAEYYRNIAVNGYSYNGDPFSSPNLVFAPLFPMAIKLVSSLPGVDEVTAGFVLNKILFLLALVFLFLYLRDIIGEKKCLYTLLSLVTSAGAYAFHSYYSESTMLLCLSLSLYAYERRRWTLLGFSAAALGASRLTALPLVLIFSSALLWQAWRIRDNKKSALYLVAMAAICPLGAAAYLTFIGAYFGNPFVLFPEIQNASWGFFHPDTPWFYILSGKNLWDFWGAALSKGAMTLFDIKSLNLFWTMLAAGAMIYSFKKFKMSLFSLLFAAYFLFIYLTGGGSDFLISAHRFYALMIPIFIMFTDLHDWICRRTSRAVATVVSGLLFLTNLFYGLLHTAYFNQGIWYYF